MEEIPPPPHRQVGLCTGSDGTGSDYSCALSEGCVLLHINDKDQRGSKKSLSYTHLFKKSQPHNIVGRSPQESSESKAGVGGGGGGDVNNKREKQPLLFVFQNKDCPISKCCWSSPKPKDTFTHLNGFTPA